MGKPASLLRGPEFNRFQTAVVGDFVPTSVNAHFDALQEPPLKVRKSTAEMERIEKVVVPSAPARRARH